MRGWLKLDLDRLDQAGGAVYGKLHAADAIERPWAEVKRQAQHDAAAYVLMTMCRDVARVALEAYSRRQDSRRRRA